MVKESSELAEENERNHSKSHRLFRLLSLLAADLVRLGTLTAPARFA
jgi:hypothetical protein